MKKVLFTVILVSLCIHLSVGAKERLVVLPISGTGMDASAPETVYMLLMSEIRRFNTYEVVPESDIHTFLGGQSCSEPVCAADIGRQANASKVAFGSLNKLGDKIIFQYHLIDVSSGGTLMSDDLTAMHVEDLDQVTKRVAASIVLQVPAEKTVEVGLVTEQESQEVKTRKSSSSWGIGFGYLYPQDGYDEKDKVFVWDFRSIYEIKHFAVDAVMGIRKGFILNIGALYMPSLKDFSPYIGAGVGFQVVAHEDQLFVTDESQKKSEDGIGILLKAGIIAFRTYDFRVNANVEYSICFNDYDDNAIVVTIGVMRAGKKVFGIF